MPGTTPSLEPASGQGHRDRVYALHLEQSQKEELLVATQREYQIPPAGVLTTTTPRPFLGASQLAFCPENLGPPAH